jgi:hypothetical protein
LPVYDGQRIGSVGAYAEVIWIIFGPYLVHSLTIRRAYFEYMCTVLGPYLDHMWTICFSCLDHSWIISGPCLDCVWTTLQPCLDLFRSCLHNVWTTLETCFGSSIWLKHSYHSSSHGCQALLAGPYPPCATALPPCGRVCQEDASSLSKPQKRRLRLQRAAVRHAQAHTQGLIANTPFLSHLKEESHKPEPSALRCKMELVLNHFVEIVPLVHSLVWSAAYPLGVSGFGHGMPEADDGKSDYVHAERISQTVLDQLAPVFQPAQSRNGIDSTLVVVEDQVITEAAEASVPVATGRPLMQ